jgi:hypothetical protein
LKFLRTYEVEAPETMAMHPWLFERRSEHVQDAHDVAGPADDVYALGVTAYRLVIGEYPFHAALQKFALVLPRTCAEPIRGHCTGTLLPNL